MVYLAELPISSDALGLIVAGIIFLVTVMLIAKKLISFLITVVLLFFAIASGMAIAHNDLVRAYFSKEKVSHTSNDENFLEPLRDEAQLLLKRIMDLLRNPPTSLGTEKPQEEKAPSKSEEEGASNRADRPEESRVQSRAEGAEQQSNRFGQSRY